MLEFTRSCSRSCTGTQFGCGGRGGRLRACFDGRSGRRSFCRCDGLCTRSQDGLRSGGRRRLSGGLSGGPR